VFGLFDQLDDVEHRQIQRDEARLSDKGAGQRHVEQRSKALLKLTK
jgi:hypothetical protein